MPLKRSSVRRFVPALLPLALVACSSGSDELVDDTPGLTHVTYECEGDREFEATFRVGEDHVTLLIDGKEIVLPQVPSGSGIAYSDGSFTYRAKGRDAYTEGWPGGDFTGCVGSNS